jgi:lactate dehydrogenase-like 2-hydroxyacid dehydrogenase
MPKRRRAFVSTLACGIDGGAMAPGDWRRLRATTASLRTARTPAPRALAGVDCLLLDIGVAAPARLLDAAPDLRYVGVFGTGFAAVDVAAARRRGIVVTNVPHYATQAVAEFTMAAVLAELRGLHAAGANSGPPAAPAPHRELQGMAFGVVGLGSIGFEVARIASAGFGARVSYWARRRRPAAERRGLRYLPLEELLEGSEVISLNLALNAGTAHILNARRLAKIQRGALLVNFASAGLVDETAMLRLVKAKRFRVVVDHADELRPETLRALRRLPNARVYPPVAFETAQARRARAETFVSNIERFLRGRPRNVVTSLPNR